MLRNKTFSGCDTLETCSLFLLSVIFRSAVMVFRFSARHDWHFLVLLVDAGVFLQLSHSIF